MKEKYINLTCAKLIQDMDYMPIIDNGGAVIQSENVKILQNYTGSELFIVELINADSLSEESIKKRIEFARAKMAEMEEENLIRFFEVFIFDSYPSQDILEIIQNASNEESYNGKFIFSSVVNLQDKTITEYDEFKMPKNNPLTILKDTLKENYNEMDFIDINQLVKEKIEQLSIKFVAKKPYLTYGLIAINISVFIILNIISILTNTEYGRLIVEYGAKVNSKIILGEYWRLLTPVFIHGGISHLAVNCYSLFILGSLVEKIYGHKKYIFIYMVAGVFGSIMSFMFSTHPSVGASGSIFGLMGALLYFGVEKPLAFKKYFKKSIIMTLILNAFIMFTVSNIDNFGHLGGLIGGFLASGIVKIGRVSKKILGRTTFIAVTIIALLGGLYYGFNSEDNRQGIILEKAIMLEELVSDGNWTAAASLGDEILDMYPSNEEVHLRVIALTLQSYINLEDYDMAFATAIYAKDIKPAYGHYLLGLVYINHGDYEDGITELKEAAKLDPTYKEPIDSIIESIGNYTN